MTVLATVLTENFDGVTAPAIPASVTVDTLVITVAASVANMSAPNQLRSVTTSAKFWETVTAACGADGNAKVTLSGRVIIGSGSGAVAAMLAVSQTLIGGNGTCYYAAFYPGVGLFIYKLVKDGGGAGVPSATILAQRSAADSLGLPTISVAVTYRLELERRFDANGIGWLSLRFVRLSDGLSLNRSTNTYQAQVAPTLVVQDSSLAAAANKYGGDFYVENVANTAYGDDLICQTTYPIGLHVWGDSLMYGWLVTSSVPDILGASLAASGKDTFNQGISGGGVGDIVINMFRSPSHDAILQVGINDEATAGYGSDATKRGFYKSALMAGIVWSCCPTKTTALAAAKTGVWTDNDPVVGQSRFSNAAGATLTFSGITGDTIYVSHLGQTVATGTWTISVDAVVVATISTLKSGCITPLGLTYCPQLVRLTGMGAGAHTVVITVTVGFCNMNWVAGIGNQSAFKSLWVGNLASLDATGYASKGVDETNVGAYNTDIASAVSTLAGDGLPVHLVDVHAALIPASDLQADGIHWDASGHVNVAAAFLTSIQGGGGGGSPTNRLLLGVG